MRLHLLFTLLFTSFMFGQLSDKHWLPPLHSRSTSNVGEHVVYLSTPNVAPFQVSVTNGNGLAIGTYTISAGNPAQFTVGTGQPSDMFVSQSGLHTASGNDGLILTGSAEFYVTFKVRSSAHGEVFVSKGRAGLGQDFRLGSAPQNSDDSNRNFVSSFMATENNTTVTVSDYDTGVTFTTPTGTNSNGSQTFTLQAGQSVVLSGYSNVPANLNGFIGARLTSTKPVAVTTGNMTANPSTGGNDICLDQIVPIELVGTEYVVVKGNGTSATELPIVIATQNNTQVFVNGIVAPIATLNTGDYYIVPFSYYQGAFNQNMYIETSKPVYLYQILAGDIQTYTVGLNFIPPLSCSFPKVVDLIPSINAIGSSSSFTSNIILLAVTGSVITINGTVTTAIPQPVLGNPSWVTYRIAGYTGNVKVVSTGSTAVGVFGESGTIGFASFYSGFGSVNITYGVGVGIEEADMTIANGLAPCPGDVRVLNTGEDPADFTFEWTVDTGSGPVILTGETGPSYTVTSPGTYCVTTSNGFVGLACTQTDCVVVEYQTGFSINNNPDDLFSCNNNFDLSQNSATILNGLDPFTYDVLFYATMQDAIDNINQIPALQTTIATVTTFYVRVETFGSTCSQVTQFDAVVSACQATMPSDMIVCDDISNNGTETFNLTTQNAAVLGGLTATDFTITYHLSQAGADANNNLATPPTAYVGGPNQVIYVRMESNANPAQYSTTTFNLIVNPSPIAAIVANTICSGQTGTVTITGTPNATVTYTVDAGANQTIVLDASGNATITSPILTANSEYCLVDVTSNATPACTQIVTSCATITVLPLPTATIAANTVCAGTTGTVTITGTANATVIYTVDAGANQTIVLDASGNAVITSPVLTSDSVYCVEEVTSASTPTCSATLTNVCATITILPLPTAAISANTTCIGSTGTVTITGTANATVTYSVDAGVNQTIVLDASGNAIITSPILTTNSEYCLVNVTSNTTPACTQIVTSCATITVLPLPTATIAANTICSGQTGTVTITGTPNATVTYSVDAGANQTIVLDASGNATITSPVLTANSEYCLVDVTSNTTPACTQIVTSCATITVLPLPTATLVANTVCAGTSGTVTITGTANATVIYTVDAGANQTIVLDASGNAVITSPVLTSDSVYCVEEVTSASTPTCSATLTNVCATITVLPLPTAAISANTTCLGSTGTVTITGTANATVTYSVDAGVNQTVVLDASGNATITSPILTTNSEYCLVDVTSSTTPACTQIVTSCATIIILPLPTATIAANTICSGQTGTVTVTGTSNATVTYTVDAGANQTIVLNASGTGTITSPIVTANSEYCLVNITSNTTCTQTLTACATVIVNPLPTVSISTATPSICSGSLATIDFTGTPDATITYTIDGASSTILLDASGNASVTSSTTSTYCLVNAASNSTPVCNESFTDCVTITVIPLPTASITGDTICDGDTAVVTFNGTPNASVNYTIDGVAQTAVTLNPSGTATVSATVAGTYCLVDVSSNTTPSCTQALTQCEDVVVLQAPVAISITAIRVCDDNNDGLGTFNLTSAVNQAQGGDPSLIVTVHETLTDAQFSSNALTAGQILSYTSINQNQILHIRVENAGGCYTVIPFDIIVDERPELNQNVTDYELCDVNASPDGVEVFDLTNATLTADISNGAPGLILTYYISLADAQVPQNAIATPATYSNTSSPNQQTIWVVAENAAGCSDITSFDLIVNPLPAITPLADMNGCSDGVNQNQAPFNLTLNDPLVTNGASGYSVTYHLNQTDANNDTNEIVSSAATPYIGTDAQVVIVRVENATTGCYTTTTLQLNVTQGPAANTPTPLTYCDPNNDSIGIFTLQDALNDISGGPTPTGVIITFHETQQDALLGTNPITDVPYNNIVPNQQTIYVSVSYTLTGCANYTQLQLIVNPTPEIVSPAAPLQECDDAVADGFTQFDLTQVETEVLNGIDPTTVTITYHQTQAAANAGTPSIANVLNYTNSSNPQTVYIRVSFNATGCYSVESFELVVSPLPIMPLPEDITMNLCDVNNPGDQTECFDLNSQIPLIINGQTNMVVTFYFSQANAIAGVNALPSPYCNTSNAQSIFVRLENGITGCFDTVIMDLRVEPLPVLVVPPPVEECGANQDGFAIFDLTALETAMLNGATDVTLSYYETDVDAQNQTNPIPNPAAYNNIDAFNQIIYVLAVNDLTGCFTIEMIQLIAHPAPIMPTLDDLVVCDTNYDGYAYFNLTQQNPIILAANTITPLQIRYYTTALDASNGTAAIVNTANFYGGQNLQTIWVVVKDPATGCSATTSFDLIINLPVDVRGQNNKLTLCDEDLPNDYFTTFDLTVMNAQILINGTPGSTITYYPSLAQAQAQAGAITNPTAYVNAISAVQTLGVLVTSADGCKSITTLTIRVEPLPTPRTNPPALVACDDDQTIIGTEQFDLTTNITYIQNNYPNLTFEYYPTAADAAAGTSEILNPTTYEGSGIIYIKVMNSGVDFFGEKCYRLVAQELIVNPLPVVVDTTYVICDDDTDGFATFMLSGYNAQLLGATQSPADFTITYYDTQANAQVGTSTGLLSDTYTNGANPAFIYPRVVNNTTGCVSALAEVTLMVKLRAIANPISQAILDTFTQCDYYTDNDGVEQFDLTAVEADILGVQTSPPITITYHLTPQDQATGDNPIANTAAYENTSNPQIIYIRVERANDDPLDTTAECYDVAEITLNVELLGEPVISSPSETICVDFTTGDLISGLTLDSGIPQGSGYDYQWSLNGTAISGAVDATYTISTVSPGDYSVVVTSTSPQGCVSDPSGVFTVIQSGPPANIQTYVTGAFEQMQTITVINEGYGSYEYQLEQGGPWQSSNVFNNIPAGVEYTISIRDVKTPNPCDGDQAEAVQVINYPHFFTPNGDGINDTWNIRGLNSQETAKIYIFDRYGKLLKQISPLDSGGWNGTLNGQPLPATDYWFTVDYYEITTNGILVPKQFKAHFSLKR